MAFVPEGQADSSRARSTWPEGAKEFSPGFTPGLFSSLALALKGLSGATKIGPEPLSRIECILAPSGLNVYFG
jgi:hypothetical protein